MFYLCQHCDRGQRYCRPHCRDKSRRLQRREANRRYQQSLGLEGRLDHRQRLKARVTDQSSLRSSRCVNLTAPPVPQLAAVPLAAVFFPGSDAEYAASWVICQICGRRGRWINPFPEVKYDCR